MTDFNKITDLISKDEGFCPHLYKCSKGFNTIGYGFNLDVNDIPTSVAKLWLNVNINNLYNDLSSYVKCWNTLNEPRRYVLVNMAYQMGIAGVLRFKNMLLALDKKEYKLAADSMVDSQWYREFTTRASRLVKIMISGEF